ncbi:MAG TPA: hypothetical protein VG895_01620 [Patescibacteria group bacterium]|nr:hypothetical protein [Patescibacteria group bacterium]
MQVGVIGTFIAVIAVMVVLDIFVKLLYKNKKRPSEIVVVGILLVSGFIEKIFTFINGKQIDPLLLILYTINLIWLYGFWNMKRWGAIGYVATLIIFQIVLFAQHKLTPNSILVVIGPSIVLYFYPKMQ